MISRTNGCGQFSFHGRFYTSYELRFTLLKKIISYTFIKIFFNKKIELLVSN